MQAESSDSDWRSNSNSTEERKGKTPIKRKMGRTCYMTNEVENMLATWIKSNGDRKRPFVRQC